MLPSLVSAASVGKLPIIDPVHVPGDHVTALWPHCTEVCVGSRNYRACPLITQYRCSTCHRVLAYLIHGLRADIKRRFHGETKVLHLWPNFSDDKSVYCIECAAKRYPTREKDTGVSFLEEWRKRRDMDHICEEVPVDYHTP